MTDTPLPPLSSPIVWDGFGRRMMPPKFAIWFPQHKQFQVYEVSRDKYPAITLKPTLTNRGAPWYFWSTLEERESRTVSLFKPRARIHTHVDVAMWFTGAWLCRKSTQDRLQCVLPVLGISDIREVPYQGSLGIHENDFFRDWIPWQTPEFHRMIIQNRVFAPPVVLEAPPASIPAFVAELLLKDAIAKEHTCPISMEPVKPGETMVTSCYHIFQTSALREWFQEHTTCPLCKQVCVSTEV